MLESEQKPDGQASPNRPNLSSRLRKTLTALIGYKGKDEATSRPRKPLPKPAPERLLASLTEQPFNLERRESTANIAKEHGTVLYLAYGSNLCYETFQKRRAIKPLSQVNVLVPELRLTFDLPGIPYAEPCFANTARRDVDQAPGKLEAERQALGTKKPGYHKDRWRKGMVGVVYEVTPSDYAHIIATEGGGASYQDIMVTCFPLTDGTDTVPSEPPSTPSFRAHTLFSPALPPPKPGSPRDPHRGGRFHRPDPAYAQPSARYLKLIADGADEHALPAEYKAYLHGIRPYTITTQGQRLGRFVFLATWAPFVMLLFALQRVYQDERGKSPRWLVSLGHELFANVWRSYDGFFKPLFGDGERTVRRDPEVEVEVEVEVEAVVSAVDGEKELKGGMAEEVKELEVEKLEDLARESLLD